MHVPFQANTPLVPRDRLHLMDDSFMYRIVVLKVQGLYALRSQELQHLHASHAGFRFIQNGAGIVAIKAIIVISLDEGASLGGLIYNLPHLSLSRSLGLLNLLLDSGQSVRKVALFDDGGFGLLPSLLLFSLLT